MPICSSSDWPSEGAALFLQTTTYSLLCHHFTANKRERCQRQSYLTCSSNILWNRQTGGTEPARGRDPSTDGTLSPCPGTVGSSCAGTSGVGFGQHREGLPWGFSLGEQSICKPLRRWSEPGACSQGGKGWAFSEERPWVANQVGVPAGRVPRRALCPPWRAGCCCQDSVLGSGEDSSCLPSLLLAPTRGKNRLCPLSPSFPVPRYRYVPSPPANPEREESHGLVGKAKTRPTAAR